jgi:hypothetical protein
MEETEFRASVGRKALTLAKADSGQNRFSADGGVE